jgi:hypothetical protein
VLSTNILAKHFLEELHDKLVILLATVKDIVELLVIEEISAYEIETSLPELINI